MKARRDLRFLSLLIIFVSSSLDGLATAATNQYWNTGGLSGDGVWGTGPADKNWNLTAGAVLGNTTWPDTGNDVAVFQDALGGTVTVFDPVQTAGISQTGAGYILNANTITLVPDATATAPFIHVQSGTLTVNSVLAGTDGLVKTGDGTLLLSNTNSHTGTTAITGGTLDLTGSLADTTVTLASGATLIDANGGLANTAAITNAGVLTINSVDTIASLANNAGMVNGTGTLTVTGASVFTGGTLGAPLILNGTGGGTFTNATIAGTFNGTTALDGATASGTVSGNTTSTGNTLVSGSLGGGFLNVTGGTLDLTGTSTNSPITISAGATLIDANGGLANTAAITNAGVLAINSVDTIASLANNAGMVNGTGTLTVTGASVFTGGTLGAPLILNGTGGGSFTNATIAGTFNGTTALDGATVSGTVSGNTTSTGNTLVSGSLGGGFLNVTGGTLDLTGTSANTPITISAGARLIDANGGLDPTANLTNGGTLTVNSADTITSYTSNGGILDGTGLLTATTATLGNGSSVKGQLSVTTLSSNGNVTVSGPVTATSTSINSGIFTLAGSPFQSQTVDVMPGGTLLMVKSSPPSIQTLNNSGTVNPGDGIAVTTYTSTGGILTSAKGGITADTVRLNDGSSIAGTITGTNLFTNGNVNVTGKIAGSNAILESGNLTLTGEFTTPNVIVDAGATLTNQSGGLSSTMILRNAGTLVMNQPDTIRTYQSTGGLLSGSALLTADSASLARAVINSPLSARSISTSGNTTTFSAAVTAEQLDVTGGTLVNTASLTVRDEISIFQNATFVAGGTQVFNYLSTWGPGPATWQGDLTNISTVGPGDSAATGILAITGDFTNAPAGTLKLDLGTGVRDLVTVGGTATFGGTLDLNQLSPVTPFVPVQVVAAGTYAGTFTNLTDNLDGVVWFNPANGTVTTLSTPAAGDTLWGGTTNQSSAWLSLYDDVVEPGTPNVLPNPAGGYSLTSGPASAGNPDLLNALTWSITPGGLNSAVLDRLSPEVYAGFQDYAIEATRAHQRTAMEAPSLGFIRPARCPAARGCKHALPSAPAPNAWEYFAALDYFDTATDSSPNQADYDLSGFGLVTGARTTLGDTLRVGGYLALNEGSLDGALIDGDADGWSLGLFARKLVHARTHTLLTGGLSYGKYQFEGTRGSLIATAGSWTPAGSAFSGVDSDALEFYLGASALAYNSDRFRLIPAVMLRYACGTMDGFAETAGGPGSPVPLIVGEDAYHSAIAELSLRAETDLTDTLSAHCVLGFSAAIRDEAAALSATFTPGGRPFRATAAGLDGDAFFLGLGAEWRIRENLGLGIHWRADFRADAETENQLGLSTSFRF